MRPVRVSPVQGTTIALENVIMDIFAILISFVIIIQFVRALLVTAGVHKAPILHSFEKYGGDEAPYLPMLYLVLWSGIFLILVWILFSLYIQSKVSLLSVGITFGFIGYIFYVRLERWAQAHPTVFMRYPRWYSELNSRTTREERRRLGYMWLRLPFNLKLVYDTNDRAFFQWVDLVLVATAPYGEPTDDPYR